MVLLKVFILEFYNNSPLVLKKSFFTSLTLVAIFFSLYSCKEETTKKAPLQKKTVKKVIVKEKTNKKQQLVLDTITTENAEAFFLNYGKTHTENKVVLTTVFGKITILLYKNTPIHRASFLYLTEIGYFNTTCFYRVVPDFIVQGGNSDNDKKSLYRNALNSYLLPAEFRKNRRHKRGTLAAARDWENNPEKKSTPFEFYFIQGTKNQSHLNGEHTVFGEIIDGLEILDKIVSVKIDKDEWPLQNIDIHMEILKKQP